MFDLFGFIPEEISKLETACESSRLVIRAFDEFHSIPVKDTNDAKNVADAKEMIDLIGDRLKEAEEDIQRVSQMFLKT